MTDISISRASVRMMCECSRTSEDPYITSHIVPPELPSRPLLIVDRSYFPPHVVQPLFSLNVSSPCAKEEILFSAYILSSSSSLDCQAGSRWTSAKSRTCPSHSEHFEHAHSRHCITNVIQGVHGRSIDRTSLRSRPVGTAKNTA